MQVCIVPEYPISLMSGGLQVQAQETYQALKGLTDGNTVELFNWSESRARADIYHFIGFPPYLGRVAELIRAAGRPYLATLLFGSSRDWRKLHWAKVRRVIKARLFGRHAIHESIRRAAGIITITEADAVAARVIYGLDSKCVEVVRHGVQESFFRASPSPWHQQYGTAPFILCVGAIQPRKNQLLLLQLCNQLRLPAVLLGPVLAGEGLYAEQVTAAARENEAWGGRWLQNLQHQDPLLISAFAACRLFVLLSASETQPISVMQAMAARKPVLLLRAPYTGEAPFAGLPVATSEHPEEILPALTQQWQQGAPTSLPLDYTWRQVARQLSEIYQRRAAQSASGSNSSAGAGQASDS